MRWGLVDAVGYGGLGLGVGVLAAWALEESSAGPVDPPGTALSLTGPSALSFGIGSPTWDVGPPGTTLAVIGATTVAGTVAGAMIGRRAERVIAEGGRVDGVHRAAVVGGAVLAGGTLGRSRPFPSSVERGRARSWAAMRRRSRSWSLPEPRWEPSRSGGTGTSSVTAN